MKTNFLLESTGLTLNDGTIITTADNTNQLTLISTDADSSAGPVMEFYRNSSSAADSDGTGLIYFTGENDADEKVFYGQIYSQIRDASDGTEDASIDFITMVGGTGRSRMYLAPTETVFNEASVDLDFRVESNGNTSMLHVDAANDRVGIGTSSPTNRFEVIHDNIGEDTVARFGGDGGAGSIPDVRIFNSNQSSGSTDEGARLIFQLGDINAAWLQAFKEADGTSAGNRTGGVAFYTSNANSVTEKMRIAADGKVGIGTTAPAGPLHVAGHTSSLASTFEANGNGDTVPLKLKVKANNGTTSLEGLEGQAGSASSGNALDILGTDNIKFKTGASERVRINSLGYLMINTSSVHGTNARLYVNGANSSTAGMAIVNNNDSGTIYSMYVLNSSDSLIGGISNNGSSTTFATSSDYRLKENINYDWNGTEKLKQLKPAQFNFINNGDETVEGFIAHETDSIAPYAVVGEKTVKKCKVWIMEELHQYLLKQYKNNKHKLKLYKLKLTL